MTNPTNDADLARRCERLRDAPGSLELEHGEHRNILNDAYLSVPRLVAELTDEREVNVHQQVQIQRLRQDNSALVAERDALKAEVERLRKPSADMPTAEEVDKALRALFAAAYAQGEPGDPDDFARADVEATLAEQALRDLFRRAGVRFGEAT